MRPKIPARLSLTVDRLVDVGEPFETSRQRENRGPFAAARSTAAGKTIRRTPVGAWSGPERADIFVTEPRALLSGLVNGLLIKPVEPEIFVDLVASMPAGTRRRASQPDSGGSKGEHEAQPEVPPRQG
jgi:hypothetical protein